MYIAPQRPGERTVAPGSAHMALPIHAPDEPPAPRLSATEVVADYLRGEILAGRLRPGEHIRQQEVAAANDTSRVPVREALRMLASEGLVHLVQHSGARVAGLDYTEFSELYRIREAIEPMLLEASVPVLTDEAIDALDALADHFDAAGSDLDLLVERDRNFHLATFAPEAMPHSFRIARDFWNRTQRYRRRLMSSLSEEQIAMVSMEHRMIIGSIRERDGEGAAERHRLHVRHTRIRLVQRPDIFDPLR